MSGTLKDVSQGSLDSSEFAPYADKLTLICGACGKRRKYAVGSIFWAPERREPVSGSRFPKRNWEEEISFSGYFRCGACHASGPWKFPQQTILTFLKLVLMANEDPPQDNDSGFYYGAMALFDGTIAKSAAWAEDYLRELIRKSPEEALLYNRLGNVLLKAGLNDEAQQAFEQAIERQPDEISSLDQLGDLAIEAGDREKAVAYFQQALKYARDCDYLKDRERRRIVDNSIQQLLELDAFDQALQALASENLAASQPSSHQTVYLTEFDLDQDEDWQRLIELFLYSPEKNLSQDGPQQMPPFMKAARFPGSEIRMERNPKTGEFQETGHDEFERLVPLHRESRRISRNETCPCGSGKKYKRCCGKE